MAIIGKTGKIGTFLSDKLTKFTLRDKLLKLLKSPSKITDKDDLIELRRIKGIKSKSNLNRTYKDYINQMYDKYYSQ